MGERMSMDVLFTVEETAHYLKVSKHTLNRWRVIGGGPPFVKQGPRLVRYLKSVLDDWMVGRGRASTSDGGVRTQWK